MNKPQLTVVLNHAEERQLARTIEIGLYARYRLQQLSPQTPQLRAANAADRAENGESGESRDSGESGQRADLGNNGNPATITGQPDDPSAQQLHRLIAEGQRAYEQLYLANIGLVITLVNKVNRHHCDRDELVQEGYLGLGEAIMHYDYTKPARFATFASYYISRHLSDKEMTATGVSKHCGRLKRKLTWVRATLEMEQQRPVTMAELADKAGMSLNVVRTALNAGTIAVDKPALDVMTATLPTCRVNVDAIDDSIFAVDALRALKQLDPLSQWLVRARFGLGQQALSWEDLAHHTQMSRVRVRRMVCDALERLRVLLAVDDDRSGSRWGALGRSVNAGRDRVDRVGSVRSVESVDNVERGSAQRKRS